MKEYGEGQPLDHLEVFMEMRQRGIKQVRLAKRLNRSCAAITFALQGKSPKLLGRIKRYLDRLPRKAA